MSHSMSKMPKSPAPKSKEPLKKKKPVQMMEPDDAPAAPKTKKKMK